MVSSMQALAVVAILAALAYVLYLWNKRRETIECPGCGARIDVYADECPHCGHAKGEPVAGMEHDDVADAVESDTTDDPAAVAAAATDVDYDDVVAGTVAEVKERVKNEDLDPEKVLAAEQENKDRVTLTDWLERRADD